MEGGIYFFYSTISTYCQNQAALLAIQGFTLMSEDRKTIEAAPETQVLLARLASGNREIELGYYEDMEEVFKELDQNHPPDSYPSREAPKR